MNEKAIKALNELEADVVDDLMMHSDKASYQSAVDYNKRSVYAVTVASNDCYKCCTQNVIYLVGASIKEVYAAAEDLIKRGYFGNKQSDSEGGCMSITGITLVSEQCFVQSNVTGVTFPEEFLQHKTFKALEEFYANRGKSNG